MTGSKGGSRRIVAVRTLRDLVSQCLWMASDATDPGLAEAQPQLGIQLVGGPTAILEYGGLRCLTDPALSPPVLSTTGQRSADLLLMLERGQRAAV